MQTTKTTPNVDDPATTRTYQELLVLLERLSTEEVTDQRKAISEIRCRTENMHLCMEQMRKVRNQTQRVNDKYKRDLVKASRKHHNHLQRELEKEKTRRKQNRINKFKLEAQGLFEGVSTFFKDVSQVPSDVSSAARDISDTTDNAKTFFDSATDIMTSCKGVLEKLQAALGFSGSVDLIVTLCNVYNLIKACRNGDKLSVVCCLVGLSSAVGVHYSDVLGFVGKCIESCRKPSTPAWTPQTANSILGGPPLVAQVGVEDLMSGDWQWGTVGALSLITLAIRGKNVDYKEVVSSYTDFGRAAIGFKNASDMMNWFTKFVKNQISLWTTGKTADQLALEEKYPDMECLFVAVKLLESMDPHHLDRSRELCKLVVQVHDRIDTYRVMALRSKDAEIVSLLQVFANRILRLAEKAISSPAHVVSSRVEPMSLYMYGKSGVGKSVLSTFLETKIYQTWLVDTGATINDFVFTRNAECEFWDGYHNQAVVKYDDILQINDLKNQGNPELLEIVRIVNETAFHLHMAQLSEKKNVYFDSKFVLATSNVKVPQIVSLADPTAFLRRWKYVVEVKVNPKFGIQHTDSNKNTYYRIDQKKLAQYRKDNGLEKEAFVEDVYLLDEYDIFDNTPIQTDMTLKEMWKDFETRTDANANHSSGLRASIERIAGVSKPEDSKKAQEYVSKLSRLLEGKSIDEQCAIALTALDADTTNDDDDFEDAVSAQDDNLLAEGKDDVSVFEAERGGKKVWAVETCCANACFLLPAVQPQFCDKCQKDVCKCKCVEFWKTAKWCCDQKCSIKHSICKERSVTNSSGHYPWLNSCIKRVTNMEEEIFRCVLCNCDMKGLTPTNQHLAGARHKKSIEREKLLSYGLVAQGNDAADIACGDTGLKSDTLEVALEAFFTAEKQVKRVARAISVKYQAMLDSARTNLLPKIREYMKKGKSSLQRALTAGGELLSFVVKLFDSATQTIADNLGFGGDFAFMLKSLTTLITVYYGARWFGGYPECRLQACDSLDVLKKTTGCGCKWCKKHWQPMRIGTNPIGSRAHGLGFLKYLARTFPRSKWSDMLIYQKGIVAESWETKTMHGKTQVFAESRTPTKTDRHSVVAAVPMYSMVNGEEELVAQVGDIVQLEIQQAIAIRNGVHLEGDSGGKMCAVFVTGRTLLVPNHFLRYVRHTFIIQNPYTDGGTTVYLKECLQTQLTDKEGKLVDLVLLTLPNTVPSRRNIVTSFATANELGKCKEGEICVSGFREVSGRLAYHDFHSPVFTMHDREVKYVDKEGNPLRVHSTVWYNVNTRAGDCGALVYAKNKLMTNKLIGMHVAGKNGTGVAILLSQEFIQRNLADHIKSHKLDIRSTVDARIPFVAEAGVVEKKLVDSVVMLGDCLTLGTLKAPSSNSQTQINKSAIHGVFEPTMAPSRLRSFTNADGEVVNPMKLGIQKVMGIQKPVDRKLLEIAVNDVAQTHASLAKRFVLTYEQAVEGVEGEQFYTPLNRRTSPGYPYCLNNPMRGKRYWFGSDETYVISEEVRKDVIRLINHCKLGQRGDVVFIATLKDERRPLAKVNVGKTRVFEAAPMHYVIAVRMYFMSFVSSVMENRIQNEVSVGVDPFSLEWSKIAESLQKFGNNIFAGDFTNFDGSLQQEVLWKICDIINDWYDDGPENAQIRQVLWEEVCNSRVLVGDELIQQTHSQPSGNPLTVIVNSLYNQIVMRMAYLVCKAEEGLPPTCDFRENVSLQCYGDDNVLNVSQRVSSWYNQERVTPALKTVGMTYTDEAKSGISRKFTTLDNVSYLKRRFVRGDVHYWAPLELSVVKEMVNWIHGKERKKATAENVSTSLRELAQHGPKVYTEVIAVLRPACSKAGLEVRFPTWTEFEQELFHDMHLQ
nr:MAG: polyprotein 1 [Picornavirales sp.]